MYVVIVSTPRATVFLRVLPSPTPTRGVLSISASMGNRQDQINRIAIAIFEGE